MNGTQKKEIVRAIKGEISRLGSASKVAVKCRVSSATISQMMNENWELIRDEMWQKVASSLNVSFQDWQITETSNMKTLFGVFQNAQKMQMFIPVSHRAGSGKSVAAFQYVKQTENSFLLQCREWAKRDLLLHLCSSLGIDIPSGVVKIDALEMKVIGFFDERSSLKPLLILDESDKLKPAALRFIIPFFNALEDKVGLVILGTEHLKKDIKKGVQLQKKGYDEIDSRFGRNYIELIGHTSRDVANVCKINGIHSESTQKDIFKEANPIQKRVGDQFIQVVEDLRRVKRIVKRELLMLAR